MHRILVAAAFLAMLGACGSSPEGPGKPVPGPGLMSPSLGDTISGKDVIFLWEPVTDATGYTLQIASDSAMTDPAELTTPATSITYQPGLSGTYWWRVSATIPDGTTDWSETWNFYLDNPCL